MNKLTMIDATIYSGMDYHDTTLQTIFLTENNSYHLQHPSRVMAEHIHKELTDMVQEYEIQGQKYTHRLQNIPSVNDIEHRITHGLTFTCTSEDGFELYASWKTENNTLYQEYSGGQFTQTIEYQTKVIAKEDIAYIICENFLCPTKGVPTVSRFYTKPVYDEKTAKAALEQLKLHKTKICDSIRELIIVNRHDIQNTEWYQLNEKAIHMLEAKPELDTEENFRIFVKDHIKTLETA